MPLYLQRWFHLAETVSISQCFVKTCHTFGNHISNHKLRVFAHLLNTLILFFYSVLELFKKLRQLPRGGVGSSVTEQGVHLSVTSLRKFYLLSYGFLLCSVNASCEYSATQYFRGDESHSGPPGIGKKAFFVLTVGPVGCFLANRYRYLYCQCHEWHDTMQL